MKSLLASVGLMWIASFGTMATVAQAGDGPVVVELYTSQGCSSCPPADALLHKLAKDRDVIALALHVDYWDYIGWKDQFADPAYTTRQRGYARAANARTIYTPQMVIGGKDHVIGNRPNEVSAALQSHMAKTDVAVIEASRSGRNVQISGQALKSLRGNLIVQIVEYTPSQTVAIKRGENAGRTLEYSNVVSRWDTVGTWNGRGELSMSARLTSNGPAAVIVQRADHGEIIAAAHVN